VHILYSTQVTELIARITLVSGSIDLSIVSNSELGKEHKVSEKKKDFVLYPQAAPFQRATGTTKIK
jgi:hypothetical protein